MADDRTCVASFFRLFRPRRSSWKLGRKKQTPLSLSLRMLINSPARQGGNFSARHIGRRTEGGEERKEGGRAEGGRESGRREGEREEEGRERKGGRLGERKLEVNQRAKGERN